MFRGHSKSKCKTLLSIAVESGNVRIIQLLVAFGANVDLSQETLRRSVKSKYVLRVLSLISQTQSLQDIYHVGSLEDARSGIEKIYA